MKKQKRNINFNKSTTNSTEKEDNIFRFITTIAGIIILLFVVYLIAGIFFTKEIDFSKKDEKKDTTEATIDNKTITAGQIFDQKDASYYVIVYDKESELTNLSTFTSMYSEKEGSLPIYTVDSSKKLNSNFLTDKDSNPNATSYDDLKIKSPTLIKIENKKITSYVENESEIKTILKGE